MAVIFYDNGKSAKKVVQFRVFYPNCDKIMEIIIPERVNYETCA